MNIRTITNNEDLEKFRTVAARYIEVLLPLEYLQKSKVVVCCLPNGEFCGGYMLVKKGPLRVLESIPTADSSKIDLKFDNVAEITGLWLDSNKADTVLCSVIFWLKLYIDLVFSGYNGFVYAYTLRKRNLAKIYSLFGPINLFQGVTKQLEGMAAPEVEAVDYIERKKVVVAPFIHYRLLIRRFSTSRKRKYRNKTSFLRLIYMAISSVLFRNE